MKQKLLTKKSSGRTDAEELRYRITNASTINQQNMMLYLEDQTLQTLFMSSNQKNEKMLEEFDFIYDSSLNLEKLYSDVKGMTITRVAKDK